MTRKISQIATTKVFPFLGTEQIEINDSLVTKKIDMSSLEQVGRKVISIGTPGNDTNYPTEKAVRDALNLKEDSLGFTPENTSNKVTILGTPGNDINYPSEKAVRDALNLKENLANKVTVIGTPGNDTDYPSEKAVRDGLNSKADLTHQSTHLRGGSDALSGLSNLTGLAPLVEPLNVNSNPIVNVPNPVNPLDAVNKQTLDAAIEGLSWKDSARAATTVNITLSANQVIDGVSTVDGDRILVKDQTLAQENGLYEADSGGWQRTVDADTESKLLGMSVFIEEGIINDNTNWLLTTNAPIIVGTTPLNYTEFGSGGGSSQTPILQPVDYAGFPINNLNYLEQNEIAEPAAPAANKVRMWAELESGINVLKFKGSDGLVQNILQDDVILARNNTGSIITRGQAVYFTGALGNKITIALAKADANATMPSIGLARADIGINAEGPVLVRGRELNVNTLPFTIGDILYVSDTVAGDVTNIKPPHPNISQVVGVVITDSATIGEVDVITGTPTGDELGTNSNSFLIGDAQAGAKSIILSNGFNQTIQGDPTTDQTINVPDVAGVDTLAVLEKVQTLQKKTLIDTIRNAYDLATRIYAATLNFDFDSNEYEIVPLTGDLDTLSTSNGAANKVKAKVVYLVAGASARTVTFNAGWFTPTSDPNFVIPANEIAILSLNSHGAAETDVIVNIKSFVP